MRGKPTKTEKTLATAQQGKAPQRRDKRSSSCSVVDQNVLFFTKEPEIEKRLARLTRKQSVDSVPRNFTKSRKHGGSHEDAKASLHAKAEQLQHSKQNPRKETGHYEPDPFCCPGMKNADFMRTAPAENSKETSDVKDTCKRTSIKKVKPSMALTAGPGARKRSKSNNGLSRTRSSSPKLTSLAKQRRNLKQDDMSHFNLQKIAEARQASLDEKEMPNCSSSFLKMQTLMMNQIKSVPSKCWSANIDSTLSPRLSSTSLNSDVGLLKPPVRSAGLPRASDQFGAWEMLSGGQIHKNPSFRKTSAARHLSPKHSSDTLKTADKCWPKRMGKENKNSIDCDRMPKTGTGKARVRQRNSPNRERLDPSEFGTSDTDYTNVQLFQRNIHHFQYQAGDLRNETDYDDRELSMIPLKNSDSVDGVTITSSRYNNSRCTVSQGNFLRTLSDVPESNRGDHEQDVLSFNLPSCSQCQMSCSLNVRQCICQSPVNAKKETRDLRIPARIRRSDTLPLRGGSPSKKPCNSLTDAEDWSAFTPVCHIYDASVMGKSSITNITSRCEDESIAVINIKESEFLKASVMEVDSDHKDTSTWITAQQAEESRTTLQETCDERIHSRHEENELQSELELDFENNVRCPASYTDMPSVTSIKKYVKKFGKESRMPVASNGSHSDAQSAYGSTVGRSDTCERKKDATPLKRGKESGQSEPKPNAKINSDATSKSLQKHEANNPGFFTKPTQFQRQCSKIGCAEKENKPINDKKQSPQHSISKNPQHGISKNPSSAASNRISFSHKMAEQAKKLIPPESSKVSLTACEEDLAGLNELIKGIVLQFSKFSPPRTPVDSIITNYQSSINSAMLLQEAHEFKKATSFPAVSRTEQTEPTVKSIQPSGSPVTNAFTNTTKSLELIPARKANDAIKPRKLKIRVSVKPSKKKSGKILLQEAHLILPDLCTEIANHCEGAKKQILPPKVSVQSPEHEVSVHQTTESQCLSMLEFKTPEASKRQVTEFRTPEAPKRQIATEFRTPEASKRQIATEFRTPDASKRHINSDSLTPEAQKRQRDTKEYTNAGKQSTSSSRQLDPLKKTSQACISQTTAPSISFRQPGATKSEVVGSPLGPDLVRRSIQKMSTNGVKQTTSQSDLSKRLSPKSEVPTTAMPTGLVDSSPQKPVHFGMNRAKACTGACTDPSILNIDSSCTTSWEDVISPSVQLDKAKTEQPVSQSTGYRSPQFLPRKEKRPEGKTAWQLLKQGVETLFRSLLFILSVFCVLYFILMTAYSVRNIHKHYT